MTNRSVCLQASGVGSGILLIQLWSSVSSCHCSHTHLDHSHLIQPGLHGGVCRGSPWKRPTSHQNFNFGKVNRDSVWAEEADGCRDETQPHPPFHFKLFIYFSTIDDLSFFSLFFLNKVNPDIPLMYRHTLSPLYKTEQTLLWEENGGFNCCVVKMRVFICCCDPIDI